MRSEKQKRQQLKDDLAFFAEHALRIRTKSGAIEPLKFNSAQRYLHNVIELQRQRTGKVRALIMKGRQQGISTYIEARFYHRVTNHNGQRAFILTHEDEATKNIFEMAKRYLRNAPPGVTPHTEASNARELLFDVLDSGYRVSTAGTKDTGRSATFQLFHGSEVAYWPHAESHASGALQAVPNDPDTEVILESTSNGPTGLFHSKWQVATRGESEYIAIFIPWFWQEEYRNPVTDTFEPTSEEKAYADRYRLANDQLAWRRDKITELGGIWHFRREYPATPEEAFSAESPGALWKRSLLEQFRVQTEDLPEIIKTKIALDPATTSAKTSDEWGMVWGSLGSNGHAYIQADETARLTPKAAAQSAVSSYKAQEMNGIVYESNQGGDMVPTIIHMIDANVNCDSVHASKGKRARAEPVHALYEQGKVHHVGVLAALEDEMCTWDAATSNESPNRLDALVWLVTDLLIANRTRVIDYKGENLKMGDRWK